MKHLIIAKNKQYFWNHIQDRFKDDEIKKVNKTQGRVFLKNGDEFVYISSNDDLRGQHGVEVKMWSVPDWFDFRETEILAQLARHK